jgi:hypothetical protein
MKNYKILLYVFPISISVVLIKFFVFAKIKINDQLLSNLIESSDITIIFTGAFFVMGFLLAGVLSDFKESEKIPGEIASNLEAIQDWIYLAFKAPRTGTSDLCKETLSKDYLKSTMEKGSNEILYWLNSKEKDSMKIFPLIRQYNAIAYYFAERGVDKEAIKGIQENTNAMRKQLTRAYTISRTTFVGPAYTLVKSILVLTVLLLLLTKFKSLSADIFVTLSLSFLFFYIYFLVLNLDNPFDAEYKVDLKPIDRFIKRLSHDF